jgi:regulator of sigma E protease
MVAGVSETWRYGGLVLTSLYRVIRGRDSFRQTMGGPIEIGRQTGRALEQGFGEFWRIVAFLSITLGIVNILPIPALDGGHLVFLLYEGITRREPSLRVRIAMQNVGMVVLLAFMAFMVINDILRL